MYWWQIAERQAGVITREQLMSGGRSSNAIDRACAAGELTRTVRGVYLVGGAPLTFRARLWSAVLSTDGVLCRATAGRLWGVLDGEHPDVHVLVPHSRRLLGSPGVIVHRSDTAQGSISHRCELPVTSRRATVLDLLASLPRNEAFRFADRALQRGWITQKDLTRRLSAEPRRRGNAQLRDLVARTGDGAAADSERLLHRLLRQAGITGWRANHEVWTHGELVAVVDVAVVAAGIAIEVDGMAYHVDVDRFRRDRTRQNALVALGWTVLRFTWADLTERPGYVLSTIRRVAA